LVLQQNLPTNTKSSFINPIYYKKPHYKKENEAFLYKGICNKIPNGGNKLQLEGVPLEGSLPPYLGYAPLHPQNQSDLEYLLY